MNQSIVCGRKQCKKKEGQSQTLFSKVTYCLFKKKKKSKFQLKVLFKKLEYAGAGSLSKIHFQIRGPQSASMTKVKSTSKCKSWSNVHIYIRIKTMSKVAFLGIFPLWILSIFKI